MAIELTLKTRSFSLTLNDGVFDLTLLFPYTFEFYFAETKSKGLTLKSRPFSLTLPER